MSKLLNKLALLFFVPFLMGTYCSKHYNTEEAKQVFTEKINIYPAQKTYSINDTIWLDFQTADKTLYDSISRQRLFTSRVKFNFQIILIAKYDFPTLSSGVYCEFIHPVNLTPIQQTSTFGTSTSFEIGCDNAPRYDTKVGLVLKQKGIYVIDIETLKLIQPCIGEVNPYPGSYLIFTYNIADTNKDIYLSIPDSDRTDNPPGFTEKQLDKKLAYAIRVE